MSKTIPPLDLMFLLTETADSPKHVSALMTFEPPASGARTRVRELVRACRAATPVAPFTYVSDFALTGAPRWKVAAKVDLVRHVHHLALPAGADDDALLELVQRLHETTMDRSRPGFEMFFIEGLAGGGFALFVRLHHAIVDGASAMSLLLGSMNDAAATKRIQPFFALELSAARARPPKGLLDRVTALQKTARTQATALAGLSFGLVKKRLGRLLGNGQAGSEPFRAPRTPLNDKLRTPRSIANAAAAKAELGRMSKDTAMLYAITAFGLAEAEAELSHRAPAPTQPLASFVLSNVPGSATPLYLSGARMSGMYPISSIAAGMGLNVTLASYAGSMDFGFVGNGVALPHLPELARHTREAFDELKAAAAILAPPPEPKAADKPARKVPKKAARTARR